MKNSWPVKKLGEVADYINGKAFKQGEWSSTGLPIIRIQNLTGTQSHFNHFDGELEERYLVKRGDILLSWSASLGVYIWDKEEAALNQHIFKVAPNKNEIDKNFLFYLLQTKVEEMESKVHGGTMKHITKDAFEKIQISLPSIKYQKKIVERLDAIRKAQELIDLQIQKTEELTGSVVNEQIEKFNSKKVKLGDVCEYEGGTQPPKSTFLSYPKEGYIRLLQIRDYKSDKDAVYIPIKARHKTCDENDVMIGRYGPPVFQILKGKSGAYNVALMKCKPNKKALLHDWLFYFLRTNPVQEKIINLSMRARQWGVNPRDLDELMIPLPSISEQAKILEKLDATEKYKTLLHKQKQLYKELFDTVLYKSMNGEYNN